MSFYRTCLVSLGLALFLQQMHLISDAHAQSLSQIKPRVVRAGSTTTLTLLGKGLEPPLRVLSNVEAQFEIESVESDRAIVKMELPSQTELGPIGIWVASKQGPAPAQVLFVEDFPFVDEHGDNHSFEKAQLVTPPITIEGTSNGLKRDYFKLHVDDQQRLAFSVQTLSLGSTMDPVIRIFDASGNQLRMMDDDEIGPEPKLSHEFEQAGDYWIEVQDNRYSEGGRYLLRIGDFPHVAHSVPLAVQRGIKTEIQFESLDTSVPLSSEVLVDAQSMTRVVNVSTSLTQDAPASIARLRVTDFPVHWEPDSRANQGNTEAPVKQIPQAISLPVAITGTLSEPSQQDIYLIQAVKDKTFRFSSTTRSLGSRALLRMKLLNKNNSVVAQSVVNSNDEWFFDYKFTDDGQYRLTVDDLVNRGGPGFGYLVEISEARSFAIAWKPDAKSPEQFLVDEGNGASVLHLQVSRFGYDGEIHLSLKPENSGLKLLDPVIPAGAKEVRVLLLATESWQADSAVALQIVGEAAGQPDNHALMSSLNLHRTKHPHVPFPDEWNNGIGFYAGRDQQEEYYAVEPTAPLVFAKPLSKYTADLSLKRTNDNFKGAVELLQDPGSADLKMTSKTEGDVFHVTWAGDPSMEMPAGIRVLTYSEFSGSSRVIPFQFPIEWIDPIQVELKAASPIVVGKSNPFTLSVLRQGEDPQPATLKFTKVPDQWMVPETIAISPESDGQDLEIQIPEFYADSSGLIHYELTSQYQGSEFTISGQFHVEGVIPMPVKLMTYPEQIELDGLPSQRQLVITGYDALGVPRDWTKDCDLSLTDPAVAEIIGSAVHAKGDGSTDLLVKLGDEQLLVPIQVRNTTIKKPIQFESDVLVALSKQGCNSGACHGSPSGKGMFRLSLRAFDKQLDELTLIREDFGRRINRIEPEASLLLQKPLMKISHGGGKKLHESDPAYAILRDWIAAGAKTDSPDTARCVQLEVFPNEKRVMSLVGGRQQLSIMAHFSDGTAKDVTELAVYESSDTSVAEVDKSGFVHSVGAGEAVILVRFLEHIESIPIMFIENDPNYQWVADQPHNYIDELVYSKLKQLQYTPSPLCSDSEFIRRVYLDVLGVLPSVEESRHFLSDSKSDKRSRLIDELLGREEYSKFWALKWGDLLKMTKKDVGDAGVYKYHRWLEESFRMNLPYDQFVSQLLRAEGSTLANPPANFFRTSTDMNECVETVSQVFMGARLQCAKCHNHPFERWTQDNYYGLGAFFNRVQRRNTQRPDEMFIWTSDSGEVSNPRTGQQMKPWLPELGELDPKNLQDRRDALVDWLVQPENPFFARIEANRIWSQFFSRGIVHPIDDFRDSNPPSNEKLLRALAEDFSKNGFNRKHLIRTILNSRTYQSSCEVNDSNREDVRYFSHQRPRMLGAEQLLDAVNHTTGLHQKLGNLPMDTKATQIPAPDLVNVEFLKVFGQPERSTVCACERAENSNLGMAIELFNGKTIHEKLGDAKNRFRSSIESGESIGSIVKELYLAALCREPTEAELQAALEHCELREQPADGLEDVCWALLNTNEFLFQH